MATLQISCSEQFKRDIDDLAASFGKSTSQFLFERVARIVELNAAQIERYRKLREYTLIEDEPTKRRKKKVEAGNEPAKAGESGV